MSGRFNWKARNGGPLSDWPEVLDEDGRLIARFYTAPAEEFAKLFAMAPRLAAERDELLAALRDMVEGLEAAILDEACDSVSDEMLMPPACLDRAKQLLERLEP